MIFVYPSLMQTLDEWGRNEIMMTYVLSKHWAIKETWQHMTEIVKKKLLPTKLPSKFLPLDVSISKVSEREMSETDKCQLQILK